MRAAHAAAAGAAVGAARAPAVRVSPVGQLGVAAAVVPSAAALHKYVSSSLRPLSFDATARAGTDWKAAVHPQLPPLWYAGLNKGALTRPRARTTPGPGWAVVAGATPRAVVAAEPSWAAAERSARSAVTSNAAAAEWRAGGAHPSAAPAPPLEPFSSPAPPVGAGAAGAAAGAAAVAARRARGGAGRAVEAGAARAPLAPLTHGAQHGGVFAAGGDAFPHYAYAPEEVSPPPPYCCPYPGPYCTLTPSLPSRSGRGCSAIRAAPTRCSA
jgi:hypothetical protein